MSTKNKTSTTSTLDHTMTPGLLAAHLASVAIMVIVVKAMVGFADIADALAFYGVYHRERWNQVIHFFGVPGILWTLMIMLAHIKVPIVSNIKIIQQILPAGHQFTYALLGTIAYAVFYLTIDPFGGSLYLPILYVMYMTAVYWTDQDQKKAKGKSWSGTGRLMTITLVVHILSWYAQIAFGHKIFEGAQPAALQSLGGALTVAPLFAFYEGLWLAGINKQLQNQTLDLVAKYTQELCTSGEVKMRVCETLNL